MSDALSYDEEYKITNKKIVNGYIRANIIMQNQIPTEIIHLCFKYYHVLPERFDANTSTKNFEISNKGLTATKIDGGSYVNAYGSVGIKSKGGGKYQWTLTITKQKLDHIIGIISNRRQNQDYRHINYGYQTGSKNGNLEFVKMAMVLIWRQVKY